MTSDAGTTNDASPTNEHAAESPAKFAPPEKSPGKAAAGGKTRNDRATLASAENRGHQEATR